MAESALNKRLLEALRPFDPVRVENGACPGTPDIECTLGWIESKYLERWPTRVPIVKCEHYTPQQRVWAIKRRFAGGRVFFMLQVGKDYLLFHGDVAAKIVGHSTKEEMLKATIAHWEGRLCGNKAFVSVLKNPDNPLLWETE